LDKITVERSIWINAPRERVWQAVTEPEQFQRWFLAALPWATLKRDAAGTFIVGMGEMENAVSILEGVEPPRKVTSRSLPDRQLATTYTLDEENNGTRITITMIGFESLPEDARQDRVRVSGAAWDEALQNLKAFIDGQELPFPAAAISPLYGHWREPKQKIAVERSIWMNAPRERVWRAISDPEQIQKWFSPGTPWRSSGLEVGGKLTVYDPASDTHSHVQIFEVVDPPRQLVTRNLAEPPEVETVTTYTLTEENGGTRLTLVYSGYENDSPDARFQNMEQNTFGFGMMLENLRAYIEGKDLPYPGGF
jgi:uncharacterized protein YndB with AHSA1/START domain